jgi:hypothetical protein
MDDFYDSLITGQVSGTALEWWNAIDSVKHLLQINDFKGASAGYSRLIDKRYYEENTDEKYVIDVSYPEFESAVSGGLNETINKIIYEDRIQSDIQAFKDEISSYGDEDFLFNYYLGIDYSVPTYDENLISINIDTYPYLGGAHGMLYFYTYNFDLEKQRLIGLEDVFIQDYDYRSIISEYCRQDLKEQMQDMGFEPDEDWITDGTDPDYTDTFTNYLFTSEGIIMKFQAYQVAPYAAGDFSVDIPYSLFEGNIDKESAVYKYLD